MCIVDPAIVRSLLAEWETAKADIAAMLRAVPFAVTAPLLPVPVAPFELDTKEPGRRWARTQRLVHPTLRRNGYRWAVPS